MIAMKAQKRSIHLHSLKTIENQEKEWKLHQQPAKIEN